MSCYTGFGNLADGRPFWIGNFSRVDRAQLLFYFPGDQNWWLGSHDGNHLQWSFAGNTTGFGDVADGRPFWIGDFNGDGRADVLFYFPGDQNWWLGVHDGNQLQWTFAGNTAGFGQVWDGRPFWVGNFSRVDRAQVLFYFPGDQNWWLGSHDGNQLQWSFAGNTTGFGDVADGRPFWIGDFNGDGRADVLFYFPGDQNWWLGVHDGNQLQWSFAGNTAGFGQVWDGRPFWIGNFSPNANRAQVLFYFPGDGNWWLGSHDGNQLQWSFAGNTTGFGDVADGRPFWIGDFNGDGRADVLFYFPGDQNWWLGVHDGNQLQWSFAGNTAGFGQVWDGRPFWIGNFSPNANRAQVLFYFPGDGNWWLGVHGPQTLQWSFESNTGRPGREQVTLHFKSVLQLTQARQDYLANQYAAIEELFADGGNIAVMRGTTEDLSGNATLAALQNLNVGACTMGTTTADQNTLFGNRNNAGANDVVVYLVNSLIGGAGNFVGCAAHPNGQPGCAIVQANARWLTAHEVGHVLGLTHVNNTDRLMNPDTGWTNPPPDVIDTEFQTLLDSGFTIPC